jgi:hypothetical protein
MVVPLNSISEILLQFRKLLLIGLHHVAPLRGALQARKLLDPYGASE